MGEKRRPPIEPNPTGSLTSCALYPDEVQNVNTLREFGFKLAMHVHDLELLQACREIDWGRITAFVQNGLPTYSEESKVKTRRYGVVKSEQEDVG